MSVMAVEKLGLVFYWQQQLSLNNPQAQSLCIGLGGRRFRVGNRFGPYYGTQFSKWQCHEPWQDFGASPR